MVERNERRTRCTAKLVGIEMGSSFFLVVVTPMFMYLHKKRYKPKLCFGNDDMCVVVLDRINI